MTGFIKRDGSLVNEVAISTDCRAGYRASITGLVPASTITDFFSLAGSPMKTVLVRSLRVWAVATAAEALELYLLKRLSANSGGTAVAAPAIALDSLDPPSGAAAQGYSFGPSALGTSAGAVGNAKLYVAAAGSLVTPVAWDFTAMKPVVLRGAGEQLCLNLNGATFTTTGLNVDVEVEWEEV